MTGWSFQEDGNGRVLVVGGDSLVGSAIRRHCRKLDMPVDVSSRRPDVGQGPKNLSSAWSAPDFTPLAGAAYGWAFVCAAVTDRRACKAAPGPTRQINVTATIELMRRLADRGTHLVFLSSSQVF